jgi:hypothetical protein
MKVMDVFVAPNQVIAIDEDETEIKMVGHYFFILI